MNLSLFQQIYVACVIIGVPIALAFISHNIFGYSWLTSIIAAVTLASFVWCAITLITCLIGEIIGTMCNKIRILFRKKKN